MNVRKARSNCSAMLSGCGRSKGLDGFEFLVKLLFDLMNRKCILQIQPELLGSPEILGQPSGHLGSNSPLLPNNVVYGGRRNTKFYRQPISGDGHRLQKLLPKNFSRMNCPTRRTLILDTHDSFSYQILVVIPYLNVVVHFASMSR